MYEASVVGKAGNVTLAKVDAQSGKVLDTAKAASIGNDPEHGAEREAEDGASDHASDLGPAGGGAGDGDGEQQDG